MLSKRTIIGLIVGSAIIGIGIYSMISDIGFQTVSVDETFGVGESTTYQISADADASQIMRIEGEMFDLTLQSPGEGLQIQTKSYKNEAELNWQHMQNGITHIKIQNTGATDMQVIATFEITTDPILFTYHIIVITSGMVIIGFSVGFTLRRPRGF